MEKSIEEFEIFSRLNSGRHRRARNVSKFPADSLALVLANVLAQGGPREKWMANLLPKVVFLRNFWDLGDFKPSKLHPLRTALFRQ